MFWTRIKGVQSMVSDRQVRRLMSLLQQEQSLQVSADKAGMHRETAGKYRQLGELPSAVRTEHDWRTRVDPFVAVYRDAYVAEVHQHVCEAAAACGLAD